MPTKLSEKFKTRKWQQKKPKGMKKEAWILLNHNWRLCCEIVAIRDGYCCQIPDCQNKQLQLDHCFSRSVKRLALDVNNLGWLCSRHHTAKSFNPGNFVDMWVKDTCRLRAGEHWWDYALTNSRKTCPDWSKVFYQEQMNIKLKEELAHVLMLRSIPDSKDDEQDTKPDRHKGQKTKR